MRQLLYPTHRWRLTAGLVAGALLSQALAPVAYAHDFAMTGGSSAGSPAAEAKGGQPALPHGSQDDPRAQRAGDPVDFSRGDFILTRQDVALPGRGLSLAVTFTYRSRSTLNGPFGYGWDMSYHRRVRKLNNNNLIVLRGANRKDEFVYAGGNYTPPPGVYDTLVQNSDGTYTLTSKHGDKEFYDVNGALARLEDRHGNALSFSYDPAGLLPITGTSAYFVTQTTGVLAREYRLTRITDTIGRTLDFSYTAEGRLASIAYVGRTITYAYDPSGSGDLISVTTPATPEFPSGNTTRYAYDTAHNLTGVTDPKNQTYLTNTYDAQDRTISQTYGSGTSTFVYGTSGANPTAEVTDRNGHKVLYFFDAGGRIVQRQEFLSGSQILTTAYEYNTNGERTAVALPRANRIHYSFDAKGNLLEVRRKKIGIIANDPSDLVATFTYEPQFNFVKTVTDPRGNVTTYTYDYELGEPAKGDLRRITFPTAGGTTPQTTFVYNSAGQVTQVTDPNGHITTNGYDAATGDLTQVRRDPSGINATTTLAYDAVGNVTAVTDPNGRMTSFAYNALNQLTQATAAAPFGFVTRYRYDANGNLVQTDRQAVAGSPGPLPTLGTVSAADNWQSTVYAYTTLDQLASVTDDLGQTTAFAYDGTGNRTRITDAKSQITTYAYDPFDRLESVTDAATPAGVTSYAYDANGNLLTLTDAKNQATTYQYDEFDRLTRMTYLDGAFEAYSYDAAGNLTQRVTPGTQTLTYAYDALNRLTTKTTPEETTTYTYDAGSRLATAADADASLAYTYDALSRVTQVSTDPTGALAATTVGYQYDAAGNRTRLTYPDSTFVTYQYDTLNRLTKLQDGGANPLADFTYDALSRRATLALANGATTTYAYDAANRLLDLTTRDLASGVLQSIAYTYDPLGNRLTRVDAAGPHTYTYDPLSQLTAADYPASGPTDTTFGYDQVGNRTTVTAAAATSYTPNTLNQYTTVGGTSLTWSANGNLTAHGLASYTYDAENRLTGSPSASATYTFDPLGRRLTKTVSGVTTRFLYDGDQLIAETDASGTLQAKYVFGPGIDEPLRLTRGGVTTWYHADGLGSITALSNSSAQIVERVTYEVFGQPSLTDGAGTPLATSSVGNRFLFTGREWDAETSLYHYRARAYSPSLGRFLQRDLFDDDFLRNRYTYVGNAPTSSLDPLGWWSMSGQVGPVILDHPDGLVGPTILSHPIPAPGPIALPHPGTDVGPTVLDYPIDQPRPTILDGPTKGKGMLQGMRRPGMLLAQGQTSDNEDSEESTKHPKKGGQKGKGKDIKQVDDVAKQLGMDDKTRSEFGRYLEETKEGRDFTFQELLEKAREFLGR